MSRKSQVSNLLSLVIAFTFTPICLLLYPFRQAGELTLHASGEGYFLPFADSLAGKETHPAGRYIEVEQLRTCWARVFA